MHRSGGEQELQPYRSSHSFSGDDIVRNSLSPFDVAVVSLHSLFEHLTEGNKRNNREGSEWNRRRDGIIG